MNLFINIIWQPRESILERLKQLAVTRGQSAEEIISEAVTLYLDTQKNAKQILNQTLLSASLQAGHLCPFNQSRSCAKKLLINRGGITLPCCRKLSEIDVGAVDKIHDAVVLVALEQFRQGGDQFLVAGLAGLGAVG